MVKIESSEIKYNSYSWFDDHGRVFTYQGKLFRGIYPEHEEYILKLIQSGLIDKLVSNNLFPETKISDYHSDEFPLIIEHAFISPQTYPFEWSFTMLKDAAINVLKINQIANEFGYQLKDCHGFNVMFDGLTPKFVDFGSFIPCNVANKDWYALDEFYRYYIYPLRLWSAGQGFWARNSLMVDFGLMPHSAYKQFRHKLLSFFKANTIDQIFIAWFVYKRFKSLNLSFYDGKIDAKKLSRVKWIQKKKLLLVPGTHMSKLIRKVERIKSPNKKTQWGDYHTNQFDNQTIDHRFQRIISIANELKDVTSAIDIAGNQGYFSRLLLEKTTIKNVISTDYDELAVDIMYNQFKNSSIQPKAIVLQNFVSPASTAQSLLPVQRFRSDLAIALALTHHLFITQHIPAVHFFDLLKQHSHKYVMVEFMPLGLYNGKNNPIIPDWYTVEWFRKEFKEFFHILIEEKLEENRILFVGEIKN